MESGQLSDFVQDLIRAERNEKWYMVFLEHYYFALKNVLWKNLPGNMTKNMANINIMVTFSIVSID